MQSIKTRRKTTQTLLEGKKMITRFCFLPFALLMLGGCSSTIHQRFSVDETPATSLAIDAKQRVILVTDKAKVLQTKQDGTLSTETQRVTCAEPSPDAMVGVATALQASLAVGEKSAGLGTSTAETIAQLGVRTPVIQLLRDGLFRACEARMNGALTPDDYERIVSYYDTTMAVLIAVDGLTSCNYTGAAGKTTSTSNSKDAAKGDSGKPAAAESADGKATVSGNAGLQTSGESVGSSRTCQISDKAAEMVEKIVSNFLKYKVDIAKANAKPVNAKQK